jgi:hypothetical protein
MNVTCTFLVSEVVSRGMSSDVGQLDGSCRSHCGPCHHNVEVDNVVGFVPREMRSAGLCCVCTCCHVADEVASCMRATLFPTIIYDDDVEDDDGPCFRVAVECNP